MKIVKEYIKKYFWLFTIAIMCLMIEVMADLMQPTLMAKIVDIGIANDKLDYVFKVGGVMIIIALSGALAATLRNYIATRVAQNFGSDLRGDLFHKIQDLDVQALDKFEKGSLITRLTNDIVNIQNLIYGLMRFFVRAPLICIGSIIMAIRLDFKLSIIILIIVPIIAFIISFSIKLGYPLYMKVQGHLDRLNISLREYLKGVRVVKAFNTFKYEENKFENKNEDLSNATIKTNRTMAIFNPMVALVVNMGIIAILLIGGFRINNGTIEVGKIIAFTNYMTQLLFALMALNNIFVALVRARASAERIDEVFNENNTVENGKEQIGKGNGTIEFNKVTFSYTGCVEEPVLKDVSFKIEKGETYGIIGSTGSGKTTLINLMLRFYEVTNGEIKINGENIKSYSLNSLREIIGVVPQKTVLFSGSIKENILWGREDATLEEIEIACRISSADEFIENLPNKYEENLEQLGVNLSGGQKQRIAIARGLIKNPNILILDDSTSAVDNKTEKKIKEGLKSHFNGVTTIIIAQKISSIMDVDKILVLDEGEIVGSGNHATLLSGCGVYQDIYKSQFGEKGGFGDE